MLPRSSWWKPVILKKLDGQKTVHDVLVFIGEGFSKSDLEADLDKLVVDNN
jgi:hypothetical protein